VSAPVTATIGFAPRLEPEDRVRADFYALLARLYFSAPDAQLLRTMGTAPLLAAEADSAKLAIAWAKLSAASRVMDPDAAREEYDALFGGVGKSLISLFGSFYANARAPGSAAEFLVAVRTALAALGLGLQTGQSMPEDHLSALFETMRLLVQGNAESAPRSLDEQQAFFRQFIAPWYAKCCIAITEAPIANFYKTVAQCTDAFLAVEDESFAIA
jgi:TorA maturation chaperone TorD